jgi:hypothetical protein
MTATSATHRYVPNKIRQMFAKRAACGIPQRSRFDQTEFFFFQLFYDLSQFRFRHMPFIRVQRHIENLGIVADPIPSAKDAAAFGFENVA